MSTQNLTRRNFLKAAAKAAVATATVAAAGSDAWASAPLKEKKLKLVNTHTGESLEVVFWRGGYYNHYALADLNNLCRDHRQNETIEMDHRLFDQMWELQQRCGGDEVFEIISGYRSPATNNMLNKTTTGVAKNSYHMKGQAIDIRLRGTELTKLQTEALAMNAGGVGYYPGSDFVHLDTGPVRNW